jgi:toxin ParE1/3/4
MANIEWDPDAVTDLRQILGYVGVEQSRPEAARRLVDRIRAACEKYATFPLMGQERSDIADGIRIFSLRPYVVFYFPLDGGIRVARVLYGARDYPRLFE